MQAGTVSRLGFCGEILRTHNLLRVLIVRFRKPYVCSNQMDVQETNFSFAQFNRIRGLRLDGIPALDLWDLIVAVLGNTTQNHDRTGRPVVEQT